MYDDTIAAISTAVGEAGIGIVRISGRDAVPILHRVFKAAGGDGEPQSHRVCYGRAIDPEDGTVLDEVLAICMLAPRSYTREDVVEIHCHGGPLPLQRLLECVLRAGARSAMPGEFTLRAFLNGRVDLAQAEAVADVIRARTDRGLSLAVKGLQGGLSRRVRDLRARLLQPLAYLEATIDFSEDDIPEEDVRAPLAGALQEVDRLLADSGRGIIYRQGMRVALVGRPNVGKSSLLNALLRADRAIVTPVAGTTRDTLEEVANFSGVPVCLVDTAGIADSVDPIEKLGVERSRRALEEADLCLLVVDSSEPLTAEDRRIAALAQGKPTVVVANKADLPERVGRSELEGLVAEARVVRTSVSLDHGLSDLERAVLDSVFSGQVVQSDELLVSNPRHQAVLARTRDHLRDALASLDARLPADCTATDVRDAVESLGEITGETAGADLLETIFSRFCIGK
jgi:tRNA modification GTPase